MIHCSFLTMRPSGDRSVSIEDLCPMWTEGSLPGSVLTYVPGNLANSVGVPNSSRQSNDAFRMQTTLLGVDVPPPGPMMSMCAQLT